MNVSVSYMAKNGLNGFKVSISSQLVDKSRVRGVVMFEAHFLVLSEEIHGFFWVLNFFDIGDERYGLSKLCGVSVRPFTARLGLGFVGSTESVVWLEFYQIAEMEEKL